jgi:hypothetical protein
MSIWLLVERFLRSQIDSVRAALASTLRVAFVFGALLPRFPQ